MKGGLLLAVICLFVVCNATCDLKDFASGTKWVGTFTRCQSLNPIYDLYWHISDNDLTVGIRLAGIVNGWVGMGISLNGGMRGADIAATRYDPKNKKWFIEDRTVPGAEGLPKLDDHQDVELLYANSDATGTTVVYKRYVIPCDVDEDHPILANATQIIFAYGSGEFGYHGNNRGSATVFFHYEDHPPALPADAETFVIKAPVYQVPAQDTTYACTPVELPSQDRRAHVIRWRPIINPDNVKYVHHILVFICADIPTENSTYQCGMAPTGCGTIMLAWSLGQPGDDWRYDYAVPIGGVDGYKHAVIQVHYNNPELVPNIQDDSGLSITYTYELRAKEVGSIIMSTKFTGLIIPPQQQAFEKWGECPTECTAKLEPIQLVNYFPHIHQLGVKIWVQHIRNGVELPEIHRDNNYDFKRQQSYAMNITVLPGDRLRLHCIWNTMTRVNNTIGGESTNDEMCAGYFQYYPSQVKKFTTCSNFDIPGKAVCTPNNKLPIDIGPFGNYTALPPRVSTCVDKPTVQPDQDAGASSLVVSFILLSLVSVILL